MRKVRSFDAIFDTVASYKMPNAVREDGLHIHTSERHCQ